MKIVSITLARGGSKEIKNKNLVMLGGKPLLFYQVRNCIDNQDISEVYVSSDSERILDYSEKIGAKKILRPDDISGDTATAESALHHLCKLVDFDVLVFAQTTSPLTDMEDIRRGIEKYKTGKYDSIFSVNKEHWIPRWTKDLTPLAWEPKNRPRRQDIDEMYVENGAFYITSRESLLKTGIRNGGRIGVVEMPLIRSFQIDSKDDLELAEKII